VTIALNLYDNVKRGDALIANLGNGMSGKMHSWRRSVRAKGGYWLGTAAFVGSTDEMLEMFLEGMARRIVENDGGITTWEGMIVEMDLTLNGVTYRRSLLPCANAVQVVYSKIGDTLFSDGSAESAAWTQVGTPSTHERSLAWVVKGMYSMHVVADAADEGTQIESGIAVIAGAAYMAGVTMRLYSGTWTFAAYRADNDNILGQSSGSPGFKALIASTSGSDVVYKNDLGETTLDNWITDQGNTTLYNPTRAEAATITAIDAATDTLTLLTAVPGTWAADDVLGALPASDRLTFTISEDSAYAGNIYVRITCDGAGEMYADAATLQRSPYRVETGWSTDDDAIDEWGRMEDILLEAGMTDASATAKAVKEANERAWPRSLPPDQYEIDVGPKEDGLSILFAGYAWTLNYLHLLAGGTDMASDHVTALIGETEFVTAGVVEANTLEFQVEEAEPVRIWDMLEEIIDAGDGSGNRWIGGVYADRKFDYGPAPTTLSYHYRGGQLLAVHGGPIEPWLALPGLARLDDAPVGPGEITGNIADDPRNIFIEEITFEAPNKLTFKRKPEDE
jgi:hypothetical protein